MSLITHYSDFPLEIGVDEAGRGPLFGRVYAGAVIWPKDLTTPIVKDSKKYSKVNARDAAFDYVIENAIAWGVGYAEADEIDNTNIYRAVISAMHRAITNAFVSPQYIIVDGSSFVPYIDNYDNCPSFTTIVGGDNKYCSIAGASIIAKTFHDRYIMEMCDKHPELEKYDLRNNKGYGTSTHMNAIKQYGITQFHRHTFKCCQDLPITNI